MTVATINTDLNDGTRNRFDAWEHSCAMAYNTVIFTGNGGVMNNASTFAAYSEDGGRKFNPMNPTKLCAQFKEVALCDQQAIYVPRIDRFAWIIQTQAGNYVLAVASPADVRDSKGNKWSAWLIPADRFGPNGVQADFPELAVGDHFLYLAFRVKSASIDEAVGVRLSLDELAGARQINPIYFRSGIPLLRPVQSTGDVGYFAAQKTASELRIFAWPESSSSVTHFDVPIATIATENYVVATPSTRGWLGVTSKCDSRILGATRSGSQVWLAWTGARRVTGQQIDAFKYPHISIAVVDVVTQSLVEQRPIYNNEFAFAWPALATNQYGDVGMSFCFGGGTLDPQYAVMLLTGPDQSPFIATGAKSVGAGGHYTGIRPAFPSRTGFCGAGGNQVTVGNNVINHPHFVVFASSSVPRIEVHTERHQLGAYLHIYGSGFTPGKDVVFYAENLVGISLPQVIGRVNSVASDGVFTNIVVDVRCRGGQTEEVTIRAVDQGANGRTATDTTTGYIC